MAKKLLCIVLSAAMLLGIFAISASAGDCMGNDYTAEDVEAIIAAQEWREDYDAGVDYKDLINRKFLTGVNWENMGAYYNIPEVAASEEIIEQNLFFWDDEIIDEYHNATSNEDYWNLYTKMMTPAIATYDCEFCGMEYDLLYDYGYMYKAEEKAQLDLEIVADKSYAKAGDTITVEVFATSNFYTAKFRGGIFYDKQYLECTSIVFNKEAHPTWVEEEARVSTEAYVDPNGEWDRRAEFWPEEMLNEEDLAKYGYSQTGASCDATLSEFEGGVMFDGELLFTATYTVKADVPEGETLEFFVPEGATLPIEDVYYMDFEGRQLIWDFLHVVYPGSSDDVYLTTTDDHYMFGQTVNANTATVITGEEPVVEPEVKGEIVDVNVADTYIGDTAVVGVEVTGSPDSLRVVTADGYQIFTRDDADIETTDAGENWVIELFVDAEKVECEVFADYGDLGVTDGTAFVLTGLVKQDLDIHSIEIPDMYPNAQNGGVITAGKHDIIIKTSTDVVKIQFYAEDGTTYTYTSWSGPGKVPYEDIDGERVWTISHAFGPYGTSSLVIRTRSETTFFAATDKTLDATVVY